MHYHMIEDERGNLVELIPFCCDACHREYCESNNLEYGGRNGCHEGSDSPEFCANCGAFAGGTAECDCQRDNVIVNRFLSEEGERYDCGHWLQLPANYLDRM